MYLLCYEFIVSENRILRKIFIEVTDEELPLTYTHIKVADENYDHICYLERKEIQEEKLNSREKRDYNFCIRNNIIPLFIIDGDPSLTEKTLISWSQKYKIIRFYFVSDKIINYEMKSIDSTSTNDQILLEPILAYNHEFLI